MLIVGERINSTKKRVQEAIKARNADFIINEVRNQRAAGAALIDVNCAVTSGDEIQDIDWVISVIQSEFTDIGLCVDSPNSVAIEKALSIYKGTGGLMINSITGEAERMERVVPIASEHATKLVALTMDEHGMPETAEERFAIAERIYGRVKSMGFNVEELYFDPLVRPVATEPNQAKEFLRAIPLIKALPGVKTICGLSNVSFGLPSRSMINAAFLAMAAHAGLDAAIIDPTDRNVFAAMKSSDVLLGRDEYCADYIRAFRDGRFA